MIIEKEAFLHCSTVSFESAKEYWILTSLKAGDWSRYFDTCGQQIWQAWEGGEKEKSNSSSCAEQRSFPSINAHREVVKEEENERQLLQSVV